MDRDKPYVDNYGSPVTITCPHVYDADDLREMAEKYPNLRVAQWAAGFPEDPFNTHLRGEWDVRIEWAAGTLPPEAPPRPPSPELDPELFSWIWGPK